MTVEQFDSITATMIATQHDTGNLVAGVAVLIFVALASLVWSWRRG